MIRWNEIVAYYDQTLIYIPEQFTPAKPLHKLVGNFVLLLYTGSVMVDEGKILGVGCGSV